MRLLYVDDSGVFRFTRDLPPDHVPPYAILSHTWGSDHEEVTYQDVETGSAQHKPAFRKLLFCASEARKIGLKHFWIDTCCINKYNFTELQESINLMFQWYSNAVRCFVYLYDVSTQAGSDWSADFRRCRWFTRGWTLQELIASRSLAFYTCEGEYLGDKHQHALLIQAITNIELEALTGAKLTSFTIERRFQWASGRQTTKPEDEIYCLLGIFGVSMTLNYAEGKEKALRRLKQEILDLEAESRPSQEDAEELAVRREDILRALRFHAMDARRKTINHALEHTCQWILQHPKYSLWHHPQTPTSWPSFLWLKGHPGAGKSTLMKFVDYRIAEEIAHSSNILVSFYFNARGEHIERSVRGMYRSLIVQLLEADQQLSCVLDDLRFGNARPPHPQYFEDPPIAVLKELLAAIVPRIGSRRLYCLIDALDESDEEDIVDMIGFLRRLGSSSNQHSNHFFILVASRHYPTLNIPHSLQLAIDREQGHQQDISQYLQASLEIGSDPQAEEIKEIIRAKANGIFIWVVLVTGILNREFRRGDIMLVQRTLQDIPQEMRALLKTISQHGDVDMSDFLLCLRWILFAANPLTLEEFYFAMHAGSSRTEAVRLEAIPAQLNISSMENFLLSNSKGLAELDRSNPPRVQFIHESVRDFLLNHDGLKYIGEPLQERSDSAAHEALKICCLRGLKLAEDPQRVLAITDEQERVEGITRWRKYAHTKYPFVIYAQSHILHHAERAARTIPQQEFCRTFDLQYWYAARIILDDFAVCLFDEPAYGQHLAFLFAAAGLRRLLRTAINLDRTSVTMRDQAGKTALVWAILEEQHEAVKALLHAGADVNTKDEYGHTPLHYCSEYDTIMLRRLLTAGADHTIVDEDGQTPLHAAAEMGSAAGIRLLLDAGADVSAMDKDGRTALHIAAQLGVADSVSVLLQAGSDANAADLSGIVALHEAARDKDIQKLELLLSAGVLLNVADHDGRTALHHAVDSMSIRAIQMLLAHDVPVHMTDGRGQTALDLALHKYRRLARDRGHCQGSLLRRSRLSVILLRRPQA